MIAADTSSLVAYLAAESGADADAVDRALRSQTLVLPPVVLTELLSVPQPDPALRDLLWHLPLLAVKPGYWSRAGAARAAVLARGLKARLPDALVCQSCLDHDVALIARDADFRHFARHCGLKIAVKLPRG